jgi:RNA-binding protein YlmH
MKSDIGRDIVDRVRDLAEQAGRRGYITNSAFLSPAERVAAENWLKKNVNFAFAGGYEGAERQVVFFCLTIKMVWVLRRLKLRRLFVFCV